MDSDPDKGLVTVTNYLMATIAFSAECLSSITFVKIGWRRMSQIQAD